MCGQTTEADLQSGWETISLPPSQVLRKLVDVHCHPTDMPLSDNDVRTVELGGLCAMATRAEDQELVHDLGRKYGNRAEGGAKDGSDYPLVISCFGYHPWFCHLLTLQSPDTPPPSKWEHYSSILLPSPSSSSYSDQEFELQRIIGDFPDPIPLTPLLERMKSHIKQAQNDGRLVMVGEVGLDKAFRIPYPVQSSSSPFVTDDEVEQEGGNERVGAADGDEPEKDVARAGRAERTEGEGIHTDIDEGATKRNTLTPFRPSMEHQLAVLDKQFEIALEMGVNVSVHSVKCQGPIFQFLQSVKKKHGSKFIDRINVDIHSCGGWSVQSWLEAERKFPNLFLSPSLAVSGRSPTTPALLTAASQDRLLVESDSHLIGNTTKRVWAAVVWVAKCKGWKIGDGQMSKGEEEKQVDEREEDCVTILHRNFQRFMRIAA